VKPAIAREAARVAFSLDTGPFPLKGKTALVLEGK
jgi:hypothetical protein